LTEQNRLALPDVYRRVRRLKLRVLRPVRTHLAGAYASAFHGPGVEFQDFALYRPGDDVRHLAWQVTARRREPYVKRYVEERELRVILAPDVSPSMDRCVGQGSLRERACVVAAMVGLAAAHNGDRVGAVLWGGSAPHTVAPARGEKHVLRILHEAMTSRTCTDRTDLRPALERVRALRGHAVVLVLSDFLVEPELGDPSVRRLLCACAGRHRVWAVHLIGAGPGAEPAGVVLEAADAESGRAVRVDVHGRGAFRVHAAYHAHAQAVRDVLAECGARVVDLGPRENPAHCVLRALASAGRRTARRAVSPGDPTRTDTVHT